ncbi:MAG: phosphatase PAP2 family protein [Allorhizobium sp.]
MEASETLNVSAPPRTSRSAWQALLSGVHPVARVCIAYVAIAIVFYPETFATLVYTYVGKFAIAVPLIIMVTLAALAAARRAASPTRFMITHLQSSGRQLLAVVILSIAMLSAFTTIKTNIPNLVNFYADPYLAAIGNAIHGGELWKVTHRVPESVGWLVDIVYSRIWFGIVFGNLLIVAVVERGPRFLRYVSTMTAVVIINGTILALAFSSVGPIFYQDFFGTAHFTGLTDTIRANPFIGDVPLYARYLLQSYETHSAMLGTGISAMPSVHVSLGALTAWYLTSLGRTGAVLGWALALFTLFGSVYTGWHYALDGYAAIILVSVYWIALSRFWGLPLMPGRRRIAHQQTAIAAG